MNKPVYLVNKDHRLYNELSILEGKVLEINSLYELMEEEKILSKADVIFDLTAVSRTLKEEYLNYFDSTIKRPVISELGLCWGEAFVRKYSHLVGATSLLFYSPKNTYEAYGKSEDSYHFVSSLYEALNFLPKRVNDPGIGFSFPRVLVQIINEAYFAYDESLASKTDIDRAMKYGVNYPLGPFEWAKSCGAKNIVALLDELHRVTGEARYLTSTALRLEAQEEINKRSLQ